MLRSMHQLFGFALEARDGRIGRVDDFFFDDCVWRVRYLVADTGGWTDQKEVLISPSTLRAPVSEAGSLPVSLTREEVRNSPEVDTHKPVSRQMEEALSLYYGWPAYWSMEPFALAEGSELNRTAPQEAQGEPSGDPHLRSARDLAGYEIRASDAETSAGTVTDLILDDEIWKVRYIVARQRPDEDKEVSSVRHILLNPWWTREIDWGMRAMHFDLTMEKLRQSPGFDSAAQPLNREFETQLHHHYGLPAYWTREEVK